MLKSWKLYQNCLSAHLVNTQIKHFWYEGLDRLIRFPLRFPPNSLRFVASEIALDGGVFGPMYGILFFSYIGFASGKNLVEVKEELHFGRCSCMLTCFGPIIQFIYFRHVPLMYQLLFANMFCLLAGAFMSWIEQQENAPWKKNIAHLFLLLKTSNYRRIQSGNADVCCLIC
ncbi:hypothetical protein MKX03_003645 [Papaver bracteatum]|nr:hypothetical protein MKX03_003645 [Papaver bracteatum]